MKEIAINLKNKIRKKVLLDKANYFKAVYFIKTLLYY